MTLGASSGVGASDASTLLFRVGARGFEPLSAILKTAILPLDEAPVNKRGVLLLRTPRFYLLSFFLRPRAIQAK